MSRLARWLRKDFLQLLFVIVATMAARSSLADHYYVPSGSMEHTLLPGDRVVVSKLAYGLRIPFTDIALTDGAAVSRGDIVIFDSPRDGTRLIKRIVAVGGDEVSMSNGRLSIDGQPLARENAGFERFGEHIAALNLDDGGGPDIRPFVVPPGKLLAVGDHRGSSLDGRYFGLIDEGEVYGKALGIYRRKTEGFTWREL